MLEKMGFIRTNIPAVSSETNIKTVQECMQNFNSEEILIKHPAEGISVATIGELKSLPMDEKIGNFSFSPVETLSGSFNLNGFLEKSYEKSCFAILDSSENIRGFFRKEDVAKDLFDELRKAYFRDKCPALKDFREKIGVKMTTSQFAYTLDNLKISCLTCRILEFDNEFVLMDWNSSFESLFEFSPSIVPGEKFKEDTKHRYSKLVFGILTDISKQGGAFGEFKSIEGANYYHFVGYKVDSDSIVLIVKDITCRKKMEYDTFVTQKLQSVGTLAGGIAHEFNNILTGIFGNISLAQNNIEDKKALNECLSKAMSSAQKARNLTRQLLTFSNGGDPVKEVIDIKTLINNCLSGVSRAGKICFKINPDFSEWKISADAGQLRYCITNILENSCESMSYEGNISINLSEELIPESYGDIKAGLYINVKIEDEGKGIDKNIINSIYDPFFSTKNKKLGLGLTIAHSIVKKHEGFIFIDSEVNKGTIVNIYLPLHNLPAIELSEKKQKLNLSHCKVLVMDDNEDILQISSKILSVNKYEVITAKDGNEAISLFEEEKLNGTPFDIVILDLTVPGGMGGAQCLIELKKIDPDIKAIVCSGYNYDSILACPEKYGFRERILKPFDIADFLKVIERVAVE